MLILFLFIVGAAMGSFVGAVVWRLRKGKDFVSERSECEHCHHTLGAFDLIPVISWLALGGKCRYCKKPIGIQALLLELILGALFVLSYIWWPTDIQGGQTILFALWLICLVGLAMLFVYDFKWYLLPNKILFPLIGIAAVFAVVKATLAPNAFEIAVQTVLAVAICAGFFGALYAVSKGKWIGFGDVKYGVFMGLILGLPAAPIALIGSYYIAAIIVLPLLITKKLTKKSHVPFGPFLIIATFLGFFFAQDVVNWYTNLFIL